MKWLPKRFAMLNGGKPDSREGHVGGPNDRQNGHLLEKNAIKRRILS